MIFNIVFFIVLTSALIQGSSIPLVARWLRLDAPIPSRLRVPLEFEPGAGVEGEMIELEISGQARVVDRQIVDLKLPRGALVVFIERNNEYIVPGGGTVLKAGDRLHMITRKELIGDIRALLEKQQEFA
jgi:cell volume regulation protein A